jgi:hypothetical protein
VIQTWWHRFDRRLERAFGDVDWSEADKDFVRASGLI